ncbi:DUF4062 domain-containing protein [Pseudomonas sp. SCPG-7]|uniref:DUF4062 domain-containing protein n=1 Tax=Pseudomonas sp. SCPG-7 TaxID=1961714 RepID=UPI000A364C51|nr:DUF4062 domain-containing protein [Pseudomonas sp. SCPG-7]
MDKRYQVFVSSTYLDLKEERQKVNQTLMEMDCIPAGMELFPATDEEQWEFIKKIIDDCDYYLLIIGGRYGSLGPEGISYTEQEFDYAVEKGIRVVALIHGAPGTLAVDKTDRSDGARHKLDVFRKKVAEGRLIKYWQAADELPGLVSLSLAKTIKAFPAVGWIRATDGSSEDLLREINELRKENIKLKQLQESAEPLSDAMFDISDLADLEDEFTVRGWTFNGHDQDAWEVNVSWNKIFYCISPSLEAGLEQTLVSSTLLSMFVSEGSVSEGINSSVFLDDIYTIAIQLKALGLLVTEVGIIGNRVWRLTSKGERLMIESRVVRKRRSSI